MTTDRTPLIFQRWETDCVAACMRMLLGYLGRPRAITLTRLRKRLKITKREGSYFPLAREVFKGLGISTRCVRGTLEDVLHLRVKTRAPIMISVYCPDFWLGYKPKEMHAIILVRIRGKRALVYDPYRKYGGRRWVSLDLLGKSLRRNAANILTLE